MNDFKTVLQKHDSQVQAIIDKEKQRQNNGLELIPSENFPSLAALQALGSVMNNKYSEGYPGKRYYGGNTFIDEMENLAISRCKQLFGCEHVNVQPYSGSPANLEIYLATVPIGEKIMGMKLDMGGHLTHGHPVNFSGKLWKFVQYPVDQKTETLDYDFIRKLALEEKPKMIVSGATAYPREIDFQRFHEIAEEVQAISMADISHIAGLIAGKAHPSPFPFTDLVMTTSHKTLRGPRGAIIMCKEKFAQAVDKAVFPGMQGGPHEHQIASKAVILGEALKPEFQNYAKQIVKNAKAMAQYLMENGIRLVSGGTDNHLILADTMSVGVTGKLAEEALDKALITVNKNAIPFDSRKPFDPSGIRLGSPAITSRGMKESECKFIGELIAKVVKNHSNEQVISRVREDVLELTKRFPMYE